MPPHRFTYLNTYFRTGSTVWGSCGIFWVVDLEQMLATKVELDGYSQLCSAKRLCSWVSPSDMNKPLMFLLP